MQRKKEEENNMKQNVDNNYLKYQELLIMSYFKTHYKKYEFNEIAGLMGMTYVEMSNSIENLLNKGYLISVEGILVLSKEGEDLLAEKRLEKFYVQNEKGDSGKKQMDICEPYVPMGFKI